MGCEIQVYIGPYININGKLPAMEKEKVIKYMTCESSSCVLSGEVIKGKFCPECGNQLIGVNRNEKYYCESSIYELTEKFEVPEVVYDPEGSDGKIMIPNKRSELGDFIIYVDSYKRLTIGEIPNPSDAIEAFRRDPIYSKFLSFLDTMRVKYDVKYGFISYWC